MKAQGSVTAEGIYRAQPSDVVKEQKRSVLQLKLKQVNRITNLVHYCHDMSKSKCYQEGKISADIAVAINRSKKEQSLPS